MYSNRSKMAVFARNEYDRNNNGQAKNLGINQK